MAGRVALSVQVSQDQQNRHFASMPGKQWLQVEVGNEIVMPLLLSFISNLDFKPLFVPIEANSGSVYNSVKYPETISLLCLLLTVCLLRVEPAIA